MATILLFHSVLGLRPVERGLAEEWRGAGHAVLLPDLYGGRTAETYDGGFAILGEVTQAEVERRALDAAEAAPRGAVLAGVSMGAGLAAHVWAGRPDAAGILFLSGPGAWPDRVDGTPVQMHAARPEPFDDESVFTEWQAANPGARLECIRYDGVGHYFLDPSLPDHGAAASAACRARCLAFLAAL